MEIIKKLEKFKEEMKNFVTEELNNVLAGILKDSKIPYIMFYAYVPYFNDGDACEYKIYTDVEYHEDWDVDYVSEEIWVRCNQCKPNPDYDESEANRFDKIVNLIYSLEPYLRNVYGDHTKLIVDKDGLTVEEYTSHD